MEEILALQRLLAAAQEQTQNSRLSDRNIVEIIDVLVKSYEIKLIYTIDGGEYLTPEYLEKQIKETIFEKGRINVVELPKLLNVGFEKIEPRIESLCQKSGDIWQIGGELVTNDYLDIISEEINEELQSQQKLSITDLAIKYNLTLEFLNKMFATRIGNLIQGQIQNDSLITYSYNHMIKSQLRGILRGCILPVNVTQLKKLYGIEESFIIGCIEEFLARREINGQFKQSNFVSSIFQENQKNIIQKFLSENKYIEYEFLQKNLFINKPKEFLKDITKDGCLFLKNCCYIKDELNNVKDHILEIINTEGFVDISNIFPSILEDEDKEIVITQYMDLKGVEIQGTIIVSQQFIEKSVSKFRSKISHLIYNGNNTKVNDQNNEDGKKKGGKIKKKKNEQESLFSREEVIQVLKDTKMIPSEYDPEFEETLFEILRDKISAYYETIKLEIFENKKGDSTEVITMLQSKVEESLTQLALIQNSLQEIYHMLPSIDLSLLKFKVGIFLRNILEHIVFLYCRKYSIPLPTNFTLNLDEEIKERANKDQRVVLENRKIFQSTESLVLTVEMLPKELSKILKESLDMINDKKGIEALSMILKSTKELYLKQISIDKKVEKNLIYAQRYFFKEDLETITENPKKVIFMLLNLRLLQKNLFLGTVDYDESIFSLLCQIILKSESDGEIKELLTLLNTEIYEEKVWEIANNLKPLLMK